MVTLWTFQAREWHDAFRAYRWLFIYGGSGLWHNPLSHRRPTRRTGLRIPGLFTQLLTFNSRANVCFHEVTPPLPGGSIIQPPHRGKGLGHSSEWCV